MAIVDWAVLAVYVVAALTIGVCFTKKAKASEQDLFVAGRSLPWYIAGTSMVATTFSADTPLFVAGAVRSEGLYANWIWWAALPAALATVFFFAHLWRRSKVITEIEFIHLRYDDSAAARAYRIMRAVNDGLLTNCISMAVVILAASKLSSVILGLSGEPVFHVFDTPVTSNALILTVLGFATVIYTAMSGLYGVVYTDLIQFGLALVGSIGLAVIMYADLASGGGFAESIAAAPGFREASVRMIPDMTSMDLQFWTFFILITVSWLSYAPGNGILVQRLLATRSERDAVLSIYWYAALHYIVRSWPWLVVGLASLVYFPSLADPEHAYPAAIQKFLPAGLKGIMVASLLAAFMSTLDTHMNWGASYLINDVYKPYLVTEREPRHYVRAARWAMLVLTTIALLVTSQLENILSVFKFLLVMLSGNAFLVVARWYWWRVTIWSEIASLLSSLIVGALLMLTLTDADGQDFFAIRLLLNTVVTAAVCIAVTCVSSREGPTPQACRFYARLRMQGAGWARVREITKLAPISASHRTNAVAWLASVVLLYCALFALGQALLGDWTTCVLLVVLGAVSAVVLHGRMRSVIAGLRS